MKRKSVLILCTGNSVRSQMAEGMLKYMCGNAYDVYSAGTSPTGVRPEAIQVLAEIGIDISRNRSKSVDEFAGKDIDFVLTVCDNAKANCPYFPARSQVFHKSFDDPAEAPGDEAARLSAFREVKDQIENFLKEFIPNLERP